MFLNTCMDKHFNKDFQKEAGDFRLCEDINSLLIVTTSVSDWTGAWNF